MEEILEEKRNSMYKGTQNIAKMFFRKISIESNTGEVLIIILRFIFRELYFKYLSVGSGE